MLTLGIDTALQSCSVAVQNSGETLAAASEAMEKGHAERLAPMVKSILSEARIEARDLERIGIVVGPGGFAGVRVGLAFARGLALGAAVNVVGVTTTAALAEPALRSSNALCGVMIDARRGQVYAALYERDGVELMAPFVASPIDALKALENTSSGRSVILTGNGCRLLIDTPDEFSMYSGCEKIDPQIVCNIAASAPPPLVRPSPVYLRPPDAHRPGRSPLDILLAKGET